MFKPNAGSGKEQEIQQQRTQKANEIIKLLIYAKIETEHNRLKSLLKDYRLNMMVSPHGWWFGLTDLVQMRTDELIANTTTVDVDEYLTSKEPVLV